MYCHNYLMNVNSFIFVLKAKDESLSERSKIQNSLELKKRIYMKK